MWKATATSGGRDRDRRTGGIAASAVCFLALINGASAESVPAAAEEVPVPVRRQDELFNGRRPDVWRLLVLVDGQVKRMVSTKDGNTCRMVAAAVALEMVGNPGLVANPERVRISCEAVGPGASA